MNNRNMLFPIVKDDIAFETLLAQAKTVIEQQSGQCWNDMGENDPGITLLEACCYGASDLAYRHSLPLKDLLTPTQEEQTSRDGIFPKEFGPQQILTCGPITEEDYRRALLDLHSNDKNDGYFFFNDAQLIREPENQRYTYWYNQQERQYSFIIKNRYNNSTQLKLTLRGNYWLYLLPSRETEKIQDNKIQAQKKLENFLRDNRNLGESVSKIIWLEPIDLPLKIDIQLDDDVKDITDIFAKVYTTAEQMVLEKPLRYTTQAMKEMGYSNEEIFNGPYLRHGWIPQLPSIKDYTKSKELNLSPLVNQLLRIKGVKKVTRFTLDGHNERIAKLPNDNWSWTIVHGYYPRLWGNDPLQSITSPNSPLTITAKGGVKIIVSKQDVEEKLIVEPLIETQPELLDWGKYRKILDYYPIRNKLPACYGLQTNTQQQIQLHQFMLPFEQTLANNCADLALLPKLLAFKQRGDTVHGAQWPFKENTVAQNVHQNIKPHLINQMNNEAKINNNDKNYTKELVILDYLLRYFGAQCATPLLSQDSNSQEDFLSTQREYLSQQPSLAYQRNNIRIDKVSALQKRIAARLGLGGECFKETPELDKLPFYLIEHRQLLPIKPNEKFNNDQTPDNLEIKNDQVMITQTDTAGHLMQGQVINLEFREGYNISKFLNLMITEVTGDTFTINTNNNNDLRNNLDKLQNAFKQRNSLHWCNSAVWIEDMDYQLVYDSEKSQEETENRRWITLNDQNSFPAMIENNDEITIRTKSDYELTTQIVQLDSANNRILLRKDINSKNKFPPREYISHYCLSYTRYDYIYGEERTCKLISTDTTSNENELWITIRKQPDDTPYNSFPFDIFEADDEITLKFDPDYELKTQVKEFDRIEKRILVEKNIDQINDFPLENNESHSYWYFSGKRYIQSDHFSFVVSIVLNRERIRSGTTDFYKLESWVKTEILAELPTHISLVIHWLSSEEFKKFASTYKLWQNNGAPLGDHAYKILETLTLGKKPSASIEAYSEEIIAS
ncbi:hypothetical protein GPY51_03745 [Photorhabdus laumondii subsp. laumondii]|uniref:Photorhabdus luminescens subsp. laumondii TTO1 complete genome segment 9/17 n=2 Tax=Photorhabdus laumondii subsp. laumondii TaxID=141679 RepID=Q7N4E4_PHOLL|nr:MULTISPECIES: hypothetical protein [Photorhabdus]AWK42154.1 hypothetical protein A4R40_11950 [Photorhabdus laumondii subsp. laumondii]AXG43016.1 hypothetical protein PluDJC_12660 [Photorhabdus laumondii subsp. laumondii]AXG47475.1 hypothetical protein PluTT01m_12320 [Photorhabdus laumondii subsp. laumondii]KTL60779.1 hypothetical protein AA106_11725 [Photorhabdus laumondii subsp. laumondii]MCC8383787.1 hypothetical protein [Photorhabdus laumondii]